MNWLRKILGGSKQPDNGLREVPGALVARASDGRVAYNMLTPHMQQFMGSWDTALCNISWLPATEALAIVLYRELSKSKVLEYDLAHYKRMSASDPKN